MKVAIDAGDVLEVALLDGDRVIGTLSLQVNGLTGSRSTLRTAGTRSASAEDGSGDSKTKKRRTRKPLSAEARERMAAAQKARWERRRAGNTDDNK